MAVVEHTDQVAQVEHHTERYWDGAYPFPDGGVPCRDEEATRKPRYATKSVSY